MQHKSLHKCRMVFYHSVNVQDAGPCWIQVLHADVGITPIRHYRAMWRVKHGINVQVLKYCMLLTISFMTDAVKIGAQKRKKTLINISVCQWRNSCHFGMWSYRPWLTDFLCLYIDEQLLGEILTYPDHYIIKHGKTMKWVAVSADKV